MSVVLATAGYDHKIRFWEAPSGICSRIIKYSDSQVNRLQITPDKQFIAAAGNPTIRLYEILSQQDPQQPQQPVLTLEGHQGNVTSIGFQRDGRYLYSGSEDGTIKVFDLRNPNYSRSFDSGAPVNSVSLRADRDELISGDQNGFVKIWSLAGGDSCVCSINPPATASIPGHLSVVSNEPQPRVTGHPTNIHENRQSKPTMPVTTTPASRRHISSFAQPGTVPIQAVDISEDSRTLVAISNRGAVHVWDPSGIAVSATREQQYHTSGGIIGTEELNDNMGTSTVGLDTSSMLRQVTRFQSNGPGHYCLQGKIAPDCRHLVTTSSDGTAKLFDTVTWELVRTLPNPKWVWDAAFCADSSYLVTASSDHVARLWNLRTGDLVRQYHGHQSAVTCVALNDSSV